MKNKTTVLYKVYDVVRIVRNQRVILDADLAKLYGVPTKRLNEAVKRNSSRFPSDFMFQLKQSEALEIAQKPQQIDMIDLQPVDYEEITHSRSQIATLNAQGIVNEQVTKGRRFQDDAETRGRNVKYLPFAFTEHGTAMAAMVLNSSKATEMSVFIIRTFMRMREQLLTTATLARRLAEIEKSQLTHDEALIDLYEKIEPLLTPPPDPERKQIGFCAREKSVSYRVRTGKTKRAKQTQ